MWNTKFSVGKCMETIPCVSQRKAEDTFVKTRTKAVLSSADVNVEKKLPMKS